MKLKLFFIAIFLLFSSSQASCQESSISIETLKKIVTFANFSDLNKIATDFEKDLIVRLIELPVTEKNNCFPESHGICKYDYYLAVSQFDEAPDFEIFKLGRFGQITDSKWHKETKNDYAEIMININKYSTAAVKYNKSLVNYKSKILLKISVNGIEQKKN